MILDEFGHFLKRERQGLRRGGWCERGREVEGKRKQYSEE